MVRQVIFALLLLSATVGCLSAAHWPIDPYDYKDLVVRDVDPVKVSKNAAGRKLVDFGRDAIDWLELDGPAAGPYEIVLGVTPLEPGFKKISIRPQLGGLKHIKGSVPTVAGTVVVEATPEKLVFTVPSPAEVVFGGKVRSFPAGRHEISR